MQLTAIQPTSPITALNQSPFCSDPFPGLGETYNRIMQIIETEGTAQEQITLIMGVFQETLEESDLQTAYIKELEEQNLALVNSHETFITNQGNLTQKIQELVEKVKSLAQEKGVIEKENVQLTQKLEELLNKTQQVVKVLKILQDKKECLAQSVKALSQEKDQITIKYNLFSQQLEEVKNEKETLLQKMTISVLKQKDLEEKFDHIQEKSDGLDAKFNDLEAQNMRETEINREDPAILRSAIWWMGVTTLVSGGLTLPLLVGGGIYALHEGLKQVDRQTLAKQFVRASKKDPTASSKDVMEKVLKERKEFREKHGVNIN